MGQVSSSANHPWENHTCIQNSLNLLPACLSKIWFLTYLFYASHTIEGVWFKPTNGCTNEGQQPKVWKSLAVCGYVIQFGHKTSKEDAIKFVSGQNIMLFVNSLTNSISNIDRKHPQKRGLPAWQWKQKCRGWFPAEIKPTSTLKQGLPAPLSRLITQAH
jgi:hypothetical protein